MNKTATLAGALVGLGVVSSARPLILTAKPFGISATRSSRRMVIASIRRVVSAPLAITAVNLTMNRMCRSPRRIRRSLLPFKRGAASATAMGDVRERRAGCGCRQNDARPNCRSATSSARSGSRNSNVISLPRCFRALEEIVASGLVTIGHSAFHAAVEQYPGASLTLRQGTEGLS